MIQRPVITPSFRVEVVESEGVLLVSERASIVLRGALYPRLVPLLDGRYTTDQVVDLLPETVPAHVYYALMRMEQRGCVVEADTLDGLPREQAAFWSALGVAGAARAGGTVGVTVLGNTPREQVTAALDGAGLHVGESAALLVVVADDYLDDRLRAINAQALATGRSWLLVKPGGSIPWLGPLIRPGGSGCWECLRGRLEANLEVESFVRRAGGGGAPAARASLPASLQAALSLAAIGAATALAGDTSAAGVLTTLDLATLETRRHTVVRHPQCPACGDAAARAARPEPVLLASSPKRFTEDGGHRTVSPEETLARYEHHVSALTGAVPRLVRVPLDGEGRLHVYAAGTNQAMAGTSLQSLRAGLRTNSSGKGLSDAQAKASALCEALERYAGCFQGDEIRERASYRVLGERAIHPNASMLFSDSQYRERDRWNADRSAFHYVPEPFDETREIEWSPVWSLTRREFRYLPTAYCYFGYRGPGDTMCGADSNGCAAGNTREEAILQGFYELAERDAVAMWWYNRLQFPTVEIPSFASPGLDELRASYAALGREVWALDITNDLGVPVFVALSRRIDGGREEPVFGFGAHLDPRVALGRALTEMSQFLVWTMGRDGRPPPAEGDPEIARWLATASLASQPYLAPNGSPARRPEHFTAPRHDDLRDDVLYLQGLVEARGLELLVLDQTRPDIGLPVVKVIVPGLRHFWARFAPGRLYDVPVQLGWRERPISEDDLNPIPLFF